MIIIIIMTTVKMMIIILDKKYRHLCSAHLQVVVGFGREHRSHLAAGEFPASPRVGFV